MVGLHASKKAREMQAQVHACKQWKFVCNASQHTQGASHAAARRVGTHHVREAVRFTEHHCQCLQGGRPCSEMQAYMRAGVNACKVIAAKLVALSGKLAAQPAQGPKPPPSPPLPPVEQMQSLINILLVASRWSLSLPGTASINIK